MKTDLERVISTLESFRDIHLGVDSPDTPDGTTWIDARLGPADLTIEHRPGRGFGLYVRSDSSFGAGPDEVYRDVDVLLSRLQRFLSSEISRPQRVGIGEISQHPDEALTKPNINQSQNKPFEKVEISSALERPRLNLKELREILGTTQNQLAKALGQQQSAISKLEGRSDMLLSTLVSWIQGLGGSLEIKAHFKQCDLPILVEARPKGYKNSISPIADTSEDLFYASKKFIESDAYSFGDTRRHSRTQATKEELAKETHEDLPKEDLAAPRDGEVSQEVRFIRMVLSKLLDQIAPLKLNRLDTELRLQSHGRTIMLDGLGYSDDATYVFGLEAEASIDTLLDATSRLDHDARSFEEFFPNIGGTISIRKILIIPDGLIEWSAIGDVAVLRFDITKGRFTNFEQIVRKFPEWNLTQT